MSDDSDRDRQGDGHSHRQDRTPDRPVVYGTAAERSERSEHDDRRPEPDTAGDAAAGAEATTYAAAVGSVPAESSGAPGDADDQDGRDDGTESAGAPARPRRRAGAVLIAVRALLSLLSIAVLAAMAVVWLRVDQLQDSTNTTDALQEAQQTPGSPSSDDGAEDYLIVGNDSRTDMQGRPLSEQVLAELRTEATQTLNTDTIIVLRVPRDGGQSYAISIPRDTSVRVPNLGREEKINGAYGITKAEYTQELVDEGETDRAEIERRSDEQGRMSLIRSVQELTGVRIDHYAEVSLYGFYLLTEVIDGVDVCLNHATSDPDSGASFAAGPQTVRGGDAVAFVRQRANLPRGDLDRIVRQQTFLASAMNKVLTGNFLTNNAKLSALRDAVAKSVVTDDDLQFLELVNQAQELASGDIEFVTIPVTGVGARNDRGQSIITVDVPAVQEWIAGLTEDRPARSNRPQGEDGESAGNGTRPSGLRQDTVPCVD